MLEALIDIAQCGDWDLKAIHNDIVESVNEYGEKVRYPKGFGKWFAKRFGLK